MSIASIALVAEATTEQVNQTEILELTFVVAIALVAIHIWYKRIHGFLYKSESIATSFGSGLAIAYVFMHLLPELEEGDRALGAPIHFITLIGFLVFYGMQRFASTSKTEETGKHNSLIFYIQLAFYSLYNFLLIYAIPEAIEQSFPLVFIYIMTMGLHLLSSDYSLGKEYAQQFNSWGRYVLVAVIVAALLIDIFIEPANELVADVLIASLAGSLLFKTFHQELSETENSSFLWFFAGVVVYLLLWLVYWLVSS